jgi:2,5-furandicarboxylate decarboxylase 1
MYDQKGCGKEGEKATDMYADIREFIRKLEEQGQLIHIKERLSPKFEISTVIKYFTRTKNVALLFDHVEGYEIPIVGNLLGAKERLALALGVSESEIVERYLSCKAKRIKPVVVNDGPVKQVELLNNVDIIRTIPVLTHHEKDTSPYFTCAITMAKDPETGVRGMGIHRIQVKDRNTVGIFLATPPLSHFLAKSEAKGVPLEIAIVIGIDPITFFSSVVRAPFGIDKLEIAGSLAGRPIEMVKCRTIDLEVPAYSEFVLEGHIIPGERQEEGPFGESTGYYFSYKSPVAEITAISHRRDPIYQALVPFAHEETVLVDLCCEMEHLKEMQKFYPFVRKIHLLNLGLIAVAQINKESKADSRNIIEHLLSNPFTKIVIVVDEDIDPDDYQDVNWAVSTRVQPERDIVIKGNMDGLVIDPSTREQRVSTDFFSALIAKTSKLGIDATKPLEDYERYEKIDVPEEIKSKVRPIVDRYLHAQTP